MKSLLTHRSIALFFLPLIFMQELHQISHSVIHAFLARLENPKETIAAFSIAFALATTLSGVNSVCIHAGISFVKDRRSLWRLLRFFSFVGTILFCTIELVGLTRWGDILFGRWMGASAAVVGQARETCAIMGLWIFPILIRNVAYALAMVSRRTIVITYATVIRLASLGVFLAIYPFWLDGASVGGAALVSCMTVEAAYMVVVVRSQLSSLVRAAGEQATYREMWQFSWPLMITQSTENGVVFVVNFFLGQLLHPDLALAAFGVVYGLVRIILAPFRNLVQTAQALLRIREDFRVMVKFTSGLLVFFVAVVFLLFYTPMRGWILESVMGLPLEMSRYTTPAVKLIPLVAVFWGFAALFRGVIAAMRQTGIIAISAGIRVLVVIAIGSVTLMLPGLNGAVVGVLAIACAFAAESLLLGRRIGVRMKSSEPMFARFSGS